MTNAEKAHLNRVAGLGCIVCINLGYPDSPAEIHHIRDEMGAGQRNSHFNTLPLCPNHHRNGGHGVAIHAGQETFEEKYGTEAQLLAQVNELLKEAA